MKMSKEKMEKSWLLDDSLIKRSLSIVGHQFLGTIIIYGGIIVVGLVFLFLAEL